MARSSSADPPTERTTHTHNHGMLLSHVTLHALFYSTMNGNTTCLTLDTCVALD